MAIVDKCRYVIKGVPFNQSLFNCFVEFDGFIKSEASVCFSKMCFFITGVIIVFAIAIVIVGDVQKQQQKSGISEKMIKLCFSWFFKYIVVVAVVIVVVFGHCCHCLWKFCFCCGCCRHCCCNCCHRNL